MQKIEIFEPAMCCSTGVCGPSVDSELLRITNLMDSLKDNKEIKAYRYNLTSNPQVFVVNETILNLLQSKGNEILPVTMVDGTVIKTGSYPTITELQAHCETLDEVENNTLD
ncbi:arsenite efflux transporter metallochaperone ArsD [Lactococcus garvieae]|uniref:arsenite efflux transporter metallochaperone ArsD n=1 Tax=Lactococcus garvieae TaxID=1363 RepID=UPI0022E33A9E|nr:arsenite efflux transporter metallochaperone ArsD [Lactococcus garvieae]